MAARFLNQTIMTTIFVALLAGAPAALFGSDAAETADESPDGSADPSKVFAYQGEVIVTQQELDAAFSAIPEAQRLAFIRDGGKVDQLVKTLLRRKAVAADAEGADYQKDPLVADRVKLAAQKELAEAWLEHVVRTAPEADFEALAREDYLLNPERYRPDGSVDVSHILIGTEERSDQEARLLATSLQTWLEKDPARFDELVKKYSDDSETVDNGGRYPEVRRGQTVPAFERAAFGLQEPGMISEPVKTPYGYHIIRLNGRSGSEIPSFDAVREQAVAQARLAYLESYRARYLQSLLTDPIVIPEGAVEIMARRHFGDDLEGAPDLAQ
jgi:peptidyl-prolyl cis-trans isomerase C